MTKVNPDNSDDPYIQQYTTQITKLTRLISDQSEQIMDLNSNLDRLREDHDLAEKKFKNSLMISETIMMENQDLIEQNRDFKKKLDIITHGIEALSFENLNLRDIIRKGEQDESSDDDKKTSKTPAKGSRPDSKSSDTRRRKPDSKSSESEKSDSTSRSGSEDKKKQADARKKKRSTGGPTTGTKSKGNEELAENFVIIDEKPEGPPKGPGGKPAKPPASEFVNLHGWIIIKKPKGHEDSAELPIEKAMVDNYEQKIEGYERRIGDLMAKNKSFEDEIAHSEKSIEKYERKLKKLYRSTKEELKHEQSLRKALEKENVVLKTELEELQFLLDEKEEISWSDDSDSTKDKTD